MLTRSGDDLTSPVAVGGHDQRRTGLGIVDDLTDEPERLVDPFCRHDVPRGLTHGEGVLESAFHRYEPVRGAIPTRPRSDVNPLNRKEYLLHVLRRV
jgi:hypothetical protein